MQLLAQLLNGRDLADFVLFALPLVAIPLLSLRLSARYADFSAADYPRRYIYKRSLISHALLILCIVLLWLTRGRPLAALGLDLPLSFPGRLGLMVMGIAAAAMLVLLPLSLFRLDGAGRTKLLARLERLKIAPRRTGEALLFLPVALVAGISEELLFRGFVIWFLFPAAGWLWAIPASALLFGLGHLYQGWRGFLSTAATGLVLGGLYALSGSLWWVMGLHALIDLQYVVVGLFVAGWARSGKECG
jgi:uncharacterized protein